MLNRNRDVPQFGDSAPAAAGITSAATMPMNVDPMIVNQRNL
ncbi:hypothetical protein [Bradyrhizobium sp. ORS 111]